MERSGQTAVQGQDWLAQVPMKLGRLPYNPQHPRNTPLKLGAYLTSVLPQPHEKVFREYAVPRNAWSMYGNDQYGDCVWAAAANLFILGSAHTGVLDIPTLGEVLGAYSAVTGFNPTTGANDNGTNMTDALAYLQDTGLGGRKILGWVAIDFKNREHRNLGVDLFGATYVGVNLPESAQDEFSEGLPWNQTESPIEGGHCILHPGYGSQGDDYVTWANWQQKASLDWSAAFIEEEYVIITQPWVDYVTKHDNGALNLDLLKADLKNL